MPRGETHHEWVKWQLTGFARELDSIVGYSGHSTIEFERVRARAVFLQELNGRYPQLAARLYQLPGIIREQFKVHPVHMTDPFVKAWVLDSLNQKCHWPEKNGDFWDEVTGCWVWQFHLDVDWIRESTHRSIREMLLNGGPDCGLGLGWSDRNMHPGWTKNFRENEDGTLNTGIEVWDGEEPHPDWKPTPIHIQHLITPERLRGEGVPADSLIGHFNPRHGDKRALAKKRIMRELRQRVDSLLTRLEAADLAEPDAAKALDRTPAHFDWLIRYQVLSQTQKAISEVEGVTPQAVSQAIANAASACGLPLRHPDPGGAPKGKKQNRAR